MEKQILQKILNHYDITLDAYKILEGYESKNIKIVSGAESYLLKIYPTHQKRQIEIEVQFISHLARELPCHLNNPIKNKYNQLFSPIDENHFARLSKYVNGHIIDKHLLSNNILYDLGDIMGQMHRSALAFNQHEPIDQENHWDLKNSLALFMYQKYFKDEKLKHQVLYFIDQFVQFVLPKQANFSKSWIHNDFNEANIILMDNCLNGIIDFGDLTHSAQVYDLGILLSYMLMVDNDVERVLINILKGYSAHCQLNQDEIESLYSIIGTRAAMSLSHSTKKKFNKESTTYITKTEQPARQFLEYWLKINPKKVIQLAKQLFSNTNTLAKEKVNKPLSRQALFPKSLKTSYKEPIHFASAAYQYMYASSGETYLDAYNNIPIIGHNHPLISKAVSNQIRTLNTNTRYNYDLLFSYADTLLSKCPASLSKVLFVNSGSEASDLAIRIAKANSEKPKIAVIDQSYHGHTNQGITISAYKFEGTGGKGLPKDTLKLPLPKLFHGELPDIEAYTDRVHSILSEANDLFAIIAEPISGCGGQVPLPASYLKTLRYHCDRLGIPLIFDEVQTGFGRIGTHFWAFEESGVIPDILILGKPMANGHPMGAVVMTEAMATSFDTGMEFFSSFGGNPVSCIIGKTVLDVLEKEDLQKRSYETGSYWMDQLKELQGIHTYIGDIRGSGLFLGVELIEPNSIAPGTRVAEHVKEYLKSKYILSSTDGKHNNVIKIKPPLCFTKDNVDEYMRCLNEAFEDYIPA